MEKPKKKQVLSPPVSPVGQWLTNYFQTRAHLASAHANFRCDPACSRPGCKNPDMLVQVSIVDLLGIAMHLEEPVSTVYRRYCSLGLFPDERIDWIRVVALKLKKICPFLENDLCGIYPVRPLPCILFPEYLMAEGKFPAYAGNDYFRNFLCLQGPLLLAPERAQIMSRIKKMWLKENLISSFYLFNRGACHLDCGSLADELQTAATGPGEGTAAGSPQTERNLLNRRLEGFFLKHITPFPPFAGVEGKIELLDNQKAQEQFLRILQDDQLRRRLKRRDEDWPLVYRFHRGKLKAKRRSLIPSEYKFC